jgi:hypothetical protein
VSESPAVAKTVADLVVRCLENEGVTHVFGIPGEENIHLVDALARSSGTSKAPRSWPRSTAASPERRGCAQPR